MSNPVIAYNLSAALLLIVKQWLPSLGYLTSSPIPISIREVKPTHAVATVTTKTLLIEEVDPIQSRREVPYIMIPPTTVSLPSRKMLDGRPRSCSSDRIMDHGSWIMDQLVAPNLECLLHTSGSISRLRVCSAVNHRIALESRISFESRRVLLTPWLRGYDHL